MKKVVRQGIFETNSSSTQSITLITSPKEEDNFYKNLNLSSDDIDRTIISPEAKSIVFYQFYYCGRSGYASEREFILRELEMWDEFEINDELGDDDVPYYMYPFDDIVKLNIPDTKNQDYIDFLKDYYKEKKDAIIKLDDEKTAFRSALINNIKNIKGNLEYVEQAFSDIESNLTSVHTISNYFFSNSPLEGYFCDIEFKDYVSQMGLDMNDENFLTKFIEKVNDENVYFVAIEGLMAYDDIPDVF